MKLKTLIALQSIIEEREIPSDMHEPMYYYSHSKEEFLDIMDMHLIHFIRAFKKLQDENNSVENNYKMARNSLIEEILEKLEK
tara:strand:- start:175 stop:423 length:249 start_codon:yes stop_codon:yes gene_type:complete